MKYLLALTISLAPIVGRAQSPVSIRVHPRFYTLLKPVRLYRSNDTLTITSLQLDSGQVISASLFSNCWVGISNINVLTSEQATSLATISPLIAGEDPLGSFAARLTDIEVALYQPPVSRTKCHRR